MMRKKYQQMAVNFLALLFCIGSSIAQTRDFTAPEVLITSPANNTPHNYFVTISGTVRDQTVDAYGRPVLSSGISSVKVRISCFVSTCDWNGSTWTYNSLGNPQQFYLPATVTGDKWQVSARLPLQAAVHGVPNFEKIRDYKIHVIAVDRAGNYRESSSLFAIVPVELTILDANYNFTGTDFSPSQRPIRETDLNRYLEMLKPQGTRAVRFQAVADGVTRLLVIAKGYEYGTLSFKNGGDISRASATLGNQCNREFDGRLDTTTISELLRRVPSDGIKQQLVQDQINSNVKFTNLICTTGMLDGGSFTHIDVDSPATEVYPFRKGANEFYWFAIFKVPADLYPYKNSNLGHLSTIYAEFTPLSVDNHSIGGRLDSTHKLLALKRPPVILVHGLNDEAKSWELSKNKVLQNAGFDVRALDYRDTNGSSFIDNELTLLRNARGLKSNCANDPTSWGDGCTILDILQEYRSRGIAISQVDVVGHSMGGLLARVFYDRKEYYLSHHNFNKGYIHRLITIGTPHLGSNVSNIIVAEDAQRVRACGAIVLWWTKFNISLSLPFAPREVMWKLLNQMNGGRTSLPATRDLAISSDELRRLRGTSVPSHAITATTKTLSGLYQERYDNMKLCPYEIYGLLRDTPDNFIKSSCAGLPCDLVVTQISQIGGLTSPKAVSHFPGVNHGDEIGSIPIREKVRDLLIGGDEYFEASGFPAPSSVPIHPPISLDVYNPRPKVKTTRSLKSR